MIFMSFNHKLNGEMHEVEHAVFQEKYLDEKINQWLNKQCSTLTSVRFIDHKVVLEGLPVNIAHL